VLSRWLDSRDKASALGRYHGDFKEKGHRWRLEERARPESAKPSKRFDNPRNRHFLASTASPRVAGPLRKVT
jgi:hypothetical protein